MLHYSVLLKETIENLNIKEDGVYIDATMGYAGHSKEILKKLKRGFLFAFDADKQAIKYSDQALSEIGGNYKIFHSNFKDMRKVLAKENVDLVDGIIFDLGFSSPQIDQKERGFSFMQDAPLDMRMDRDQPVSAYEVVNTYEEKELADIFLAFGEEKMAKIIAKTIKEQRTKQPIKTTLELVEVIKQAVGANYFFKNHPERKIFQAIRIEVNKELDALEQVLPDAIAMLKKGGRICVITFHSLEDRIVKQIFKKYSEVDDLVKGLPQIPEEYKPLIKIVNKKPILPSKIELEENSRSKSAKLRIIERV